MIFRATAVLVFVLLVAACGGEAALDPADGPAAPIAPGSDVPSEAASICFNNTEEGQEAVERIACDEPHDVEAFYQFDAGEGDEYPGEDPLRRQAVEACAEPFEEFVGVPPDESEYVLGASVPSADGWEEGRRGVQCVLTARDGEKLTGSAQGTGQ